MYRIIYSFNDSDWICPFIFSTQKEAEQHIKKDKNSIIGGVFGTATIYKKVD